MTSARLTDSFTPTHYDLSLTIDRPQRAFSGTVSIEGTTRDGSLRLHAKDLVIDSCVINGRQAEFVHGDDDVLEIQLDELTNKECVAVLGFHGTITDQMHGMYPCYFVDGGTKKELIATQFESHHAREVFPCIDEPSAKATFDVTLRTEQDVIVLGNMPVKDQRVEDDRLVTSFATTPRMSSYLLAWVYGDLHKKTAQSKGGVEVNVWATRAQPAESLDFALDIATRTIDFFDEYFGVPYPLPKCDHVALPDFSSGAMENWGLITYREVALLAEPGAVSVSSKHRIAAVIAHELSHQWFGNLVTMNWWNNLWLNESFANLMEYVAIDSLEPDWNVWFDFAAYETVASLRRDATPGVQAVQVDVEHPDEISTLFDPAIVYAKGSRLLHMLERYVGREVFRDGLRSYFKANAYGNTAETDLWHALSEASGEDIEALMTPWISQPGYPVVHVNTDSLRQERFFIGSHDPSDTLWPIPLGSNDTNIPRTFTSKQEPLTVPSDLRLNISDSAHFITHYPDTIIAQRIKAIATGSLEPIGRLQFLHEQTLLARGRVIPSAQLIPLLQAFEDESAESVWDIIGVAIGEIKKFVENDDISERRLRALARQLSFKQFTRLGWEQASQEHEADTKLRATILGLTLYGEDAAALARAAELSEGSLEAIDPELRAIILGSAVKHAPDDRLFERLLDTYRTTQSAELQQDVASALTSTTSPTQIDRLLALITDGSTVRSQDVARWFVYLIRNRHARTATWKWLRDNWKWIETTFSGDKSYDDYPRYVASSLATREQFEEYKTFFEPLKSQRALTRVISMGVTEIEARIELIEAEAASVRRALIEQQ